MAHYIQFSAPEGGSLLVEVDTDEVVTPPGVVKAGLVGDAVATTISRAQETFEAALERAIKFNVEAFYQAIQALSKPPNEIEITFGLKATGEAGNVAVVKASGEVNYTVKLAWKSE